MYIGDSLVARQLSSQQPISEHMGQPFSGRPSSNSHTRGSIQLRFSNCVLDVVESVYRNFVADQNVMKLVVKSFFMIWI